MIEGFNNNNDFDVRLPVDYTIY